MKNTKKQNYSNASSPITDDERETIKNDDSKTFSEIKNKNKSKNFETSHENLNISEENDKEFQCNKSSNNPDTVTIRISPTYNENVSEAISPDIEKGPNDSYCHFKREDNISLISKFYFLIKTFSKKIWRNFKRIFVWVDTKPENVTYNDILEKGPFLHIFWIKISTCFDSISEFFINHINIAFFISTIITGVIFVVFSFNVLSIADPTILDIFLFSLCLICGLYKILQYIFFFINLLGPKYLDGPDGFREDRRDKRTETLLYILKIGVLLDIIYYCVTTLMSMTAIAIQNNFNGIFA